MAFILSRNTLAQDKEKSPKRDQIQSAVQEICPVSGLKLGAHGKPFKAKIGGEVIFLCCEGCKKGKVKKEHWVKIHQNFAKAQSKCFVMDNPLPKKPKWVIVKGQLLYVCCPPCIKKIKDSPDKYLKQLEASQVAYLEKKTKKSPKPSS
ncbi:MAG: hypothetical protein AAF497_02430 [Planctomycetota bacterium]